MVPHNRYILCNTFCKLDRPVLIQNRCEHVSDSIDTVPWRTVCVHIAQVYRLIALRSWDTIFKAVCSVHSWFCDIEEAITIITVTCWGLLQQELRNGLNKCRLIMYNMRLNSALFLANNWITKWFDLVNLNHMHALQLCSYCNKVYGLYEYQNYS